MIEQLLSPEECRAIAGLYPKDEIFRSRVVMGRHGFGRGEYEYFSYPLPDLLRELRTAVYSHLVPVANHWNWYFGGNADVMLNVSNASPVVASGIVTYEGAPASGMLQITVEDPRDGHYLASKVTDLNGGAFSAEFADPHLDGTTAAGLRVTARYTGKTTDKGGKSLKGTAIRYLNSTPPWGVAWWAGVLVPLLFLVP